MEKKVAHVLVVDDDPFICDVIKNTLEGEDFEVSLAGDGPAALTGLKEKNPDLVLLDIKLPGIDGYEVLRDIRKTSKIPVIMLTGIQEPESVAQSLDLGADDYIMKPFRNRELVARIRAKLKAPYL
jgi:DNA-binding response OmpR family regulator